MIPRATHYIFRKQIKFCLYPVFVIAGIFIVYQLIIFSQLNHVDKSEDQIFTENADGFVRGAHKNDWTFYEKTPDNTFRCIRSMEVVNFDQINDDYCDCLDGSDEPGTNACSNGLFFCTKQIVFMNFPKSVPSNRVNDGICDCCDGSDEWEGKRVEVMPVERQKALSRYLSPCPRLC